MLCQSEGNRVGAQGRFYASVSLCKGASQGKGDPWFLFLVLFQLSAVEAGGSTAFIYANFSVPVVKVRGTWNLWEQGKEDAALCISALAGSCGQANDANPQPQGSLICFGMPKFSLGNPSSVLGCQNHLCSTECGSFLVEPAEEREW